MNVLAIYGRPRPDGNSERMLDEALTELGETAEVHSVHLAALSLAGCGPCRQCAVTGRCVIEDDMQAIYEDLR